MVEQARYLGMRGYVFKFLKRAAVFLLGSYTIVAQVVFVREFLVIFLGNELCLGVIFSSWFLGIAIGAAASARPARKTVEGEGPFLLLSSLLAGLSPLILLLIRVMRALLAVPAGEYIPFVPLLFSTWALIIPFGFLIGFVFPFACLLALRERERGVRNVGYAYVLEAAGSVFGGALFSFLLVGRFTAFSILFGWCAAILAALFLLSWEPRRPRWARLVLGACAAACALMLLTGAAEYVDALSVRLRWESLNARLPLIASVDSRYENIALAKREEQYDCFGNGQYYFSFPDPYSYAATAHMIMSEHPDPKRVLLMGGGAGGMIRELLKYNLTRLQYVELDPALIRLMEAHLGPEERRSLHAPPVAVYYGDGRRFVKQTDERFDLVVVGMPDPSTAMLNRFYTREFFTEVSRIMAPGGALSTRLSAPVDYYGEEVGNYAGSVYATLKSVFPYVLVTPTEENYFFAAAQPGVISSDIQTLQNRWRGRGIQTAYFTPYHFLNWWLPERVAFTRNALEARGGGRINTDFKPLTYYFDLILWARFSGSRIAGFLNTLEKISFAWYLLPLVVLCFVRICYILISGRRGDRQSAFHSLLAIGAMGFSAMALEMVLIFAFQNIYGYVYQMIGMIVALFMTGLACGGSASNRFLETPGRRWPLWLAGIEFSLSIYALIIPPVVQRVTSWDIHSEYVFMALVFLTGFIAGTEFPIASQIYMRYASNLGRAAARVNGFDQFGACAGSLLTGILFVPLLGLYSTCIFLMVLNAAAGILLLAGYQREG